MKKNLREETIDGRKSIILVFPMKENPKVKTMGLVQDLAITEEKVVAQLKPIVYKTCFEGEPIKFGIRGKKIGNFYVEIIKKFESSKHEVLIISDRRASVLSKRKFNKKLESMLQRMVMKKYWQELHKELKEDYVV